MENQITTVMASNQILIETAKQVNLSIVQVCNSQQKVKARVQLIKIKKQTNLQIEIKKIIRVFVSIR